MKLFPNQYYHIYNRTNNSEILFRSNDNYGYFIKKYRYYMDKYFDTIGYCLMPTHYHFLVKIKEPEQLTNEVSDVQHLADVGHLSQSIEQLEVSSLISSAMQTLQSSYTKAINKMYQRHGSLFQAHYKAKLIDNDSYLITLLAYIHQNPLRTGIVDKPEEWHYSSYLDYFDFRNGTLPSKQLILSMISKDDFKLFSSKLIQHVDQKYWI